MKSDMLAPVQGPWANDLYWEHFADNMQQPKMSTQDKIVNALPFVAFLVIAASAVVLVLTM